MRTRIYGKHVKVLLQTNYNPVPIAPYLTMHTKLIAGTSIPSFDKDIAAWLQKARTREDDEPTVVKIGIRNQDRRVYRHIIACGRRQHLDTIAFLDQSGFLALPVGFAKETGLDYVFHLAEW